jgi:hypothetical protein
VGGDNAQGHNCDPVELASNRKSGPTNHALINIEDSLGLRDNTLFLGLDVEKTSGIVPSAFALCGEKSLARPLQAISLKCSQIALPTARARV